MTDASVAIIGGGVMGVSLAYHLSEAGWQDVLLLEKNDLTHGSTWHAAGLCTHFAHNPTVQELRARSVRLYRDVLPDLTGQSCGFHHCGAMRITCNRERMLEFAHVAGLSQFTGYPLQLLTPPQIQELYPLAQLDGIIGGIFEPDDGHVDPTLATQAMATRARANGVTIMRNAAVQQLRFENNSWIVNTDKHTLRAVHVVNAAGTWGWEVGRMMGLNIPSVPVLHQYLVTGTIDAITQRKHAGQSELPIIRDPEQSWYVRQERDGLILGPYEKQAQVWSVDGVPDQFGAELLPADLQRVEPIIESAMARLPVLADAGIKSVVNGPITFTPDANPLIGPAHGIANAWLLTGSSMGVMEGGGAGWFLAHWMTHGAAPMDATAVDSRRFGCWADRKYRVEKAIECFGLQFGVHYPYEERPAARNIRKSPLHQRMLDAGAVMGAVNGWERPNWFAADTNTQKAEATYSFARAEWFDAVALEADCVANRVALADLSVLSKFEVCGNGAHDFMQSLGANSAPGPGRVALLHVLTPTGGVLSEFSVTCLSPDRYYLTSASAAERIDLDVLCDHALAFNVNINNVTSKRAVIGVMGPQSRVVISSLCNEDLDTNFSWLSGREIIIEGLSVLALRVSYVGELGWELHCDTDHALSLFDALVAAGQAYGIGLYGAYAANSMRLEKGYRAWGADLTTERTPIESGLEYLVKTDNRDFSGMRALQKRATASDRWEMVVLKLEQTPTLEDQQPVDPFYTHCVYQRDMPIGIVTSAAYGYRCGFVVALAYLRVRNLRDNLEIDVLGQRCAVSVLSQVPYDACNSRLRA